jgi:Lon protease-like protein
VNFLVQQRLDRIAAAIKDLGDLLEQSRVELEEEQEKVHDLNAKLWEAKRINQTQEKEITQATQLAKENERLILKHNQVKASLTEIRGSLNALREALTP